MRTSLSDFKAWTARLIEERKALLEPDVRLFKTASNIAARREAFLAEYRLWHKEASERGLLSKEAGVADAVGGVAAGIGNITDATLGLVKDVGLPALVVLPAMLGMYLGYRKSRITSPSEASLSNLQKQVVLDEYNQHVAELERDKAVKLADRAREPAPQRSVRALA